MPHLVETSISRAAAIAAARLVDPLATADIRACAKAWMAARPGLGCRPWTCIEHAGGLRIVGWRREPPEAPPGEPGTYVGSRQVDTTAGERLVLAGEVVAVRRNGARNHDAAQGRTDKASAYAAWLEERLVDLQAHATVERVTILGHGTATGLRKARQPGPGRSKRFVKLGYPVVRAELTLTVRDPAGVEAWMLAGTGPHKAFGYGCFAPSAGTVP